MNVPLVFLYPTHHRLHRNQEMTKTKILALSILTFALFYILIALFPYLPIGMDWQQTYRPAALALAHGKSPFSVEIFYAAPWSLIPLIPFALLPYDVGNAGIFLLGLFIFAYVAYKLGANFKSMSIFLLSASVMGCLIYGNIEWMPLIGFILPAPIGLIFAIIKPQVGIGIAIYWFFNILKTKGIWSVVKAFAPVTILTLISFWMYGFWPLRFQQTLELNAKSSVSYNTSLWPQGIFIGIWLLYKAIRNEKPRMAMASSPFLSPYALQFTWVAVLAGLIQEPLELLLISIGLWIPVIIRVIHFYLG